MPPATVLTLPFSSPLHSHDFPGILFRNYHLSLLQLPNSHTCFHVPLSILNPHVCRAIQPLPAALLIRPPCTPVNISFSRIPCPTFKNYFNFLSKGLLSPFHVPGPDLGTNTTPPPTAQIPLLHPHSFQTKANPAITRLHRLPTSSLEPPAPPPHRPIQLFLARTPFWSCPPNAGSAAPPRSRVSGRGRGSGSAPRVRGAGERQRGREERE